LGGLGVGEEGVAPPHPPPRHRGSAPFRSRMRGREAGGPPATAGDSGVGLVRRTAPAAPPPLPPAPPENMFGQPLAPKSNKRRLYK
jgi:hypothetical protein